MSDDATLDEFTDTSDSKEGRSEEKKSLFWGEIPTDWNLADGSNIYEVNPNPDPVQQPNTYIEMDALNTELPFPDHFGERNASEYSGKTFTQGDTLFARITPCTENGKAALVPEMETEVGIGSTEFAVLSPKSNIIHPWFLYYLNKSHPVHNYAVSRMRGSTGRQRVPFSVFRKELDFPLPPLEEQRKIATVLHTVDQAIQKTEEIIEQLYTVRDSLMREIFNFGIGYKGNLRSPEDSAHKFKKTPLGRIPESWECVRLGKIIDRSGGFIQTGPFGSQLHKKEYVEEGIPVVMPQNIEESKILKDEIAKITLEKANDLARHRMEPNDVIIARRGDLERAASISKREEGWLCGTGCLLIRPPESEIYREWLRMAYQHPRSQHQINSRAVGSTMSNLNQSILESLQIALPPVEEQERITEIISNVDTRIGHENTYSSRLQRLKQGLMQDLLSGEVRTTNTNIEVPEEVAKYG
jgi:type I restriction enzyme S subunit